MKKIINMCTVSVIMLFVVAPIAFAGDSVEQITSSVSQIVNAIAYFGNAVAAAMLIFVGIKYATAPANEKADVKTNSFNYLIGAFLIFSASMVASLFVNIASNNAEDTGTLATTIIEAAQEAIESLDETDGET